MTLSNNPKASKENHLQSWQNKIKLYAINYALTQVPDMRLLIVVAGAVSSLLKEEVCNAKNASQRFKM